MVSELGVKGSEVHYKNFELSHIWTKSQKLGKYSSVYLTLSVKSDFVIEYIHKRSLCHRKHIEYIKNQQSVSSNFVFLFVRDEE